MAEQPVQPNKPPQAAPQPAVAAPAANIPSGGINLIPDIAEKEIKSGVYKKKTNLVSLIVLGVVAVVIVAILIFQGALALQANNVSNKIEDASTRINKNVQVEIKAQATKEKLDKAEELLASAIPSSTFVQQTVKAAATSQPITITSLSINASGEAVVDGQATNSEVLKQWVANLTAEASKEYFAKVSAVSLTGNPSEGYKFSFKMSFLKEGVYKVNGQ